jgi:methyl-accepting chemotaxis protein/hemerythrin
MSVGVGKIDKEHQGLFDLMNRLHDGMLAGRGNETLRPVLAELGQYTKVHFGNEETLLRSHGYSRLAEHLKLHEVFRSKVGDLETQVKAGTVALSVSTLEFLRDWLSKHILGTDMQYKDFLASKGVR